jgi:hypothetical protein
MELEKFNRAKEIEETIKSHTYYLRNLEEEEEEIKTLRLVVELKNGRSESLSYESAPKQLKEIINDQLEIAIAIILTKAKKITTILEKEFDKL